MTHRPLWGAAAGIAATLLVLSGPVAEAASTGPVLPSVDSFYKYSGATPLAKFVPGTVLRSRPVATTLFSVPVPFSTTQVLYRTTGQLGQPVADVATIIRPLVSLGTKLISYQMAYDTLASQCDASYLLRGGNASYAASGDPEGPVIAGYVAAGYTVVVPDYEGTNHEWVAGQRSGYSTLDAIRATQRALHLSARTPVGMVGYSGGSVATEWAAELAPAYAPTINIVGAAVGGVPVDLAHNLPYINGSKDWSGIIPAVVVGVARGFHVDLTPYLSAYGLSVTKRVQGGCINDFRGSYPGLTVQQLFKPQFRNVTAIPALARIFNTLLMGSAPGHPTVPMLIGAGNADGIGDDVMVAGDMQGLAHEYCQQGVPVQFQSYTGLSHAVAAVPFEVSAFTFLETRMLGLPAANGCSAIGSGNKLTPLPVPAR